MKAARGDLRLDSLGSYLRKYKTARINLDPAAKPPVSAEIQMINLIAYKDPEVRRAFQSDLQGEGMRA